MGQPIRPGIDPRGALHKLATFSTGAMELRRVAGRNLRVASLQLTALMPSPPRGSLRWYSGAVGLAE
jgi:hypothetical protein